MTGGIGRREAAHNDAAGVAEAFDENLLHILDCELGAGFVPDLFARRVFYDAGRKRVGMLLDSEVEQEGPIPAPGENVPSAAGEGTRAEISAKFTRRSAGETFAGSAGRSSNSLPTPTTCSASRSAGFRALYSGIGG